MPDSPSATIAISREQLEVFRLLYPLFKREVFRRREIMIRLSTFHHAVLLLLLVILAAFPSDENVVPATRWLALTGLGVFSGFFAFVILQQVHRHRMAKQQLIALEKEMGLYKEGGLLGEPAAYPEHWQTDWQADRSITIYLVVLTSLTALVMCAMLMRP